MEFMIDLLCQLPTRFVFFINFLVCVVSSRIESKISIFRVGGTRSFLYQDEGVPTEVENEAVFLYLFKKLTNCFFYHSQAFFLQRISFLFCTW